MKIESIAHKLTDLTSNLISPLPENEKSLDTIRRVLGFNLRNNLQDISATKPPSIELEITPPQEKIQEFSKYAVSELAGEDKFLIRRIGSKDVVPVVGMQIGDIRIPINPIAMSEEVRWNQKREEQIGPFLSNDGRSIWFDFYYYEDKLTVRSQNGSVPHFLFSKARRNIWLQALRDSQTVTLQAGHVWILGKLFTNDAGDNEYVGFDIKKGSFSLSNETEWNGQVLEFAGDFTGKLVIELEQPQPNSVNAEGCSAAQSISFRYPDEITFEWKNGNLIDISADQGEVDGYGNRLSFSNFDRSAKYEIGFNHIFIPCQSEPTSWRAEFSQSRIFEATGKAQIKQSFWALPIVKVSNPTTLGPPENNGGWALRLSSDLSAKWIGSNEQQPEAILNEALLVLYPQALFLYVLKSSVEIGPTSEIRQDFSCWRLSSDNPAPISLALSYQSSFPLIYYCHATEGESLIAGCTGKIQPDRPIFADGSHISMKDLKGWVLFQARGTEFKIHTFLLNPEALKQPPKPLALQNALLIVSQPTGLILAGTLPARGNNSIEKGQVTLAHGVLRWKPILPDPYVSNLRAGRGVFETGRTFSSILYAQISWTTPNTPLVNFKGELSMSSGVNSKPPSNPDIHSLPVQLDQHTLGQIKEHTINTKQRQEKSRIDNVFDDIEKRLSGWKLLDVSTNMDLIGVCVSPPLFGTRDQSHLALLSSSALPTTNVFVIKNLAVNTPLSMVHIFTVPQVQWEPVRTLPEDQNIAALGWFPEHLGSATDGGPTRLIGINQQLAPIIPDVVAREIQKSFRDGSPAAALTTLSFGLKAAIQLLPTNSASRNADSLDIIRPEFPQKQMKGGIQINLMAESGSPRSQSHSPGFAGFMSQTLNGYELFTGIELGLSVLGATFQSDASVETQFNKEFAPGGSNPFVPVTRFDLSGYGASNFSEWDNPGALASIGKVQFKIMVGRTAFEVVKFVSKIYPWGSTVTRTVTIERRAGGGVIRKDTGWQATRAGIFDFRVTGIPNNPYEFRPGVFRGCFELKNIRAATDDIIAFIDPGNGNNVELAPIYFDADVQLEGLANGKTFSRGVLGFIQLAPKPDVTVDPWLPRLLSREALRKLITDQGAIGGPIDAMLNVGNSGFTLRVTRFEVDVADNAGTPNFVAVVRGQPAFPNNGAWSVVKQAAPGNTADPQEAVPADTSRGTPLFIENSWLPPSGDLMNVSGPAGPYRFADPIDLFAPQPRYDYGFMQNTGSQAFLFRRPIVASGTNEISSNVSPAFADPFALFTTKGVFPPIANTIEFPTANYKLIVQAGTGKLRLNTPVNLTNPRSPLLMAQDGTNRLVIEYDLSRLKYNLNYDNWNAELDTFSIWTSLAGIDKLFGSRFSLRAGTAQQSKLVDVISLLKPEIRDALSFIPGMQDDQQVKDIDLGMSNAGHEIKIVVGYECGIEIDLIGGGVEVKCLPGLPGAPEPFENKKSISLEIGAGLETGISIDLVAGSSSFVLDATLGAALQGKIPISGIFFLVLGLEMEFGWSILPTSSTSVEIAAYVGVGMGGRIGPFVAEGFLAAGLVFIYEDNTPKFGGLVKLEAEVDLKIVAVGIAAELKGVYYKGDNPDTPAVETDVSLIDASGSVAVNVSIFLVINISASYEYSTTIVP